MGTCVVLCVPSLECDYTKWIVLCFVLYVTLLEWEGPPLVRTGFDLYIGLCIRCVGSGRCFHPSFLCLRVSDRLMCAPHSEGPLVRRRMRRKGGRRVMHSPLLF